MKGRDTSMTLDEFKRYYDSHRGVISSARAYDAAAGDWFGLDRIFDKPGTYTLIVVKFRNNTFLRIDVKPSREIRYSARKYASAATWKNFGINLTYEEKTFLGTIEDSDLTLDGLIDKVRSSSFEGKETLLLKLKRASDAMKR